MFRISRINGCLAGKILRINLSDKKIWTESTAKYAEKTLGGRGINSLIMINEIGPETEWSDPENLLCFGVGSLVGTMAPGACRTDISSINVFNGGKGSGNVGGFWGQELKFAGFDNIIIEGKSEKPVYLYINDNNVEIRDANFIWGKTVFETETMLREEVGDKNIEIALIGPAGENLVRGSAIIIDTAKAAGGSGVGCVMGSKKLKAIVVRGHGSIKVAEPKKFMEAVDECYKKRAEEPKVKMMTKGYMHFYTDPEYPNWDAVLVVRNGQDDYWEEQKRIELMNIENGVPSMQKGIRACFSCPIGCMPYMEIDKGEYKGTKGEGFWINTIMGHAARFDISNPEAVVKSWLVTNEMGLDTDYVAAGLAWVFELYEKGIVSKKDTDGLELTWGNGDALIKLIKKLTYREGIGDILADGMVEAAEEIGNDAEKYLIHIKGQPSMEPFRVPKGWCLGVCTSPIAGRHMRGSTRASDNFGSRPRPKNLNHLRDGDFDIVNYKNQAKGVVWQGKSKELEDNLGICCYIGTWSGPNFLTIKDYVDLVNTGMGLNLTEDDLMNHFATIGRNLEKAFNGLHTNMSRKDDMPPRRFMEEEVKKGPYKGSRIDKKQFNEMLDEFYELWGWDKQSGMQTKTQLTKLGLLYIADKLEKKGKLIDT